MADSEPRMYGERWQVVREIGKGGQGVVYEVKETQWRDVSESVRRMNKAMRQSTAIDTAEGQFNSTIRFINELRPLVEPDRRPSAALKELLPLDSAVNATTALGRMKNEIEALRAVNHPALIKVLDEQISERWFVTEYFQSGPFSARLDLYKGRVLEALRAFRPIVEATAALRDAGIVVKFPSCL